jgi:hypothetical protein
MGAAMIRGHAFIVGAMKAGTTALFRLLSQHPAVAHSSDKEPAFFTDPMAYERGFDWYRSLWDLRAEHVWALEASTAYTKLPTYQCPAQRMKQLSGDLRMIYVVRDPVKRIRSHYLHSLAAGWMKRPIRDGIPPEPIFYSNYRYQLLPYEHWIGHERLLVLQYERFLKEPLAIARECCAFLGIDVDFRFHGPGRCNSGDDHRAVLTAKRAVETGLVARVPHELTRHGASRQTLLSWLLEALNTPDPEGTLLELEAQTRADYTPSPAQVDELHARLDYDLARFTERYGIEPWAAVQARSRARSRRLEPSAETPVEDCPTRERRPRGVSE